MSSPGISGILSLARPDLAAQQLALQRRQAFAQSLLQGGPERYTGIGGAADSFGSKLLGAFLQKSTDNQSLDLANQYRNALMGTSAPVDAPSGQDQGPPQIPLGSIAQSGLGASQPAGQQQNAPQQPQNIPLSSMSSMPAGRPTPIQPAPSQTQTAAPGQSLFDMAVPDIPGVDPRKKFVLYASDPENYMKAYYASTTLPDAVKTADFAYGGNSGAAQQSLRNVGIKAGTIDLRDKGSALIPDETSPTGYRTVYGPNEDLNEQFVPGPNGTMTAIPIAGGAAVAAQQAGAIEGAKEENKVLPEVTLPDGRRVPMYAGAAIGASPANVGAPAGLGLTSNNPGNLQPNGREAAYANPTAGILAASSNLDSYAKQGVNTLGGIISKWAPQYDQNGKQINDTQSYIADVSKRLGGVDPSQPLNLSDPNVKGAVLEAMFQHENGNKFQAPNVSASQSQLPQLGITPGQEEVAKEKGVAGTSSAHVQASSDALLKAIDGMLKINDQVPDSTFLSPDTKATINEYSPNLPGFRGDAGALQQWEQLNSIGILGGIKNLGMGRTDIPIVKQVVAGGGIPASIPAADRVKLLNTLRTEVLNNRAAAQNVTANLNQQNVTNPQTAPMTTYPSGTPRSGQYQSAPAVPQRQINQIYQTPKGPLKWIGSGWVQP